MIRHLAVLSLLVLTACQSGTAAYSPLPGPGVAGGGGLSPKGEQVGYARGVPVPVVPGTGGGGGYAPDDAEAYAFARSFLDSIQAPSIADRVEYCGYFFVDANGTIGATPPRRGTFASCNMPAPRAGMGIFASYHTHGAFGRNYDNEVPSVTDLLSDFQFNVDGYVSTPGGRVWHVDYGSRSTRQICGLRCVTADPGFVPVGEATIRASYDLQQLNRRANGV